MQIFKILFPNLSHFFLSLCQPPISILYSTATLHLSSFCITYLLPKQFPISIHILIHLPSKLFIYFLFALIYTPFNPLFFVHFHTLFFCLFIASYQHLLPSNLLFLSSSFYLIIPPQYFGSFTPLSLSHTLLLPFQLLPISPAPT